MSSIPGLGKSHGEGNGNPLQYSCLGKSHRQRSLACYSLWGHKRVWHDLVTKQQQLPSLGVLVPLLFSVYSLPPNLKKKYNLFCICNLLVLYMSLEFSLKFFSGARWVVTNYLKINESLCSHWAFQTQFRHLLLCLLGPCLPSGLAVWPLWTHSALSYFNCTVILTVINLYCKCFSVSPWNWTSSCVPLGLYHCIFSF